MAAADAAAWLRPTPTDARRAHKRARVLERVTRAGLRAVHAPAGDAFVGAPDEGELRRLGELRAGIQQMLLESVEPERLASALTHFELWRQELPSRVAFLPLVGEGSPGRLEAARYNEGSLALFAASTLRRGSLQAGRIGRPIAPETVSGYVSALRAFLSRDGGVRMLVPEANVLVPALMRGVRRGRPPAGVRRRRRGLRARHLRAASTSGLDRRSSFAARRELLAAVAGHVLLARGGELGRVRGKAFVPARGLTWRHVQWHEVGAVASRHAAATVHLCSVKDGEGRGQRFPLPIRARREGRLGAKRRGTPDPMCAVELLREAWLEDRRLLGASAALDTPVFRTSARGGAAAAYDTQDVLRVVRRVATAAGDRAADFGAHSLRIGGATDFRDLLGAKRAKGVLKGRGRWLSDIYFIYTRNSMAESLESTAGVGDVDTRELEAVFVGFTQPAAAV